MKYITVERVIWLVLVAGLITGTIYITNYVRDFSVYKEAASRCSVDKSVLHSEIEQLDAEKAKVEKEKADLEKTPVR